MKSLIACCTVTLCTLVACASNVSLGSGADGLRAGDACSADRCSGQAVKEIGCATGQPVVKCVSNGAGQCSNDVTCPGTPASDCSAAECSALPRPSDAKQCLTGSYGRDVCARTAGKCGWDFSPYPAVVPADAQALSALNAGGGFVATNPPAGSECKLGEEGYTLTRATKTLAFYTCKTPTDGSIYTKNNGSKVLSDADVASVVAAFNALELPDPTAGCAADFPDVQVEVQTPAAKQVYVDSRSICGNVSPKPVTVKTTDGVFTVVRALAK
jgi:hypothetical protein